ncbi:MAG: ATP-grasp domain-containing protein [Promethearchaeota archaeon]|nr:MAG: ATP-grasp domain-containing protein [Candidatus Lokiarchaeota archaeon]
MDNKLNSVLVVGFNTRPLAYSLNKAGYVVYAVDFFGDLDLFPFVNDFIIVMKELNKDYNYLKGNYSKFLVQYARKLYSKHQNIKFLIIGSGLDDEYEGRKLILDDLKNSEMININNDLEVIKKSRNIEKLFELIKSKGYKIPIYLPYKNFNSRGEKLNYPFILKKKKSAGGINVFKIESENQLISLVKSFEKNEFLPSEWIIQEYIKGIPISSTIISNGKECEVITINRQIIGKKFLNSPKEFMYCGNIVPAQLLKEEEALVTDISISLTKELGLKGINGFDFVLKDHYPYFMECNPRIPGSIRASETALNLNLLDLHIKSFNPFEWENIKSLLKSAESNNFITKLIYFTPKEIDKKFIPKINSLKYIHDKSEPRNRILKGEPLCTILYEGKNISESYNGAIEVVNKINRIIE